MKVIDATVKAQVHCPICTHTVSADVDVRGKRVWLIPGQKCPRCAASLDAGMVLQVLEAA